MGLRCGTYRGSTGCCGFSASPRGHLWAAAVAVPALWGIYGDLWAAEGMAMGLDLWVSMGLQCGTYGVRKGLWDCGVGLMGFALWMVTCKITMIEICVAYCSTSAHAH